MLEGSYSHASGQTLSPYLNRFLESTSQRQKAQRKVIVGNLSGFEDQEKIQSRYGGWSPYQMEGQGTDTYQRAKTSVYDIPEKSSKLGPEVMFKGHQKVIDKYSSQKNTPIDQTIEGRHDRKDSVSPYQPEKEKFDSKGAHPKASGHGQDSRQKGITFSKGQSQFGMASLGDPRWSTGLKSEPKVEAGPQVMPKTSQIDDSPGFHDKEGEYRVDRHM